VPISIENRQRRVRVSTRRLAATGQRALRALRRTALDLSVAVVGDREMRRLQRRYLGSPHATDVLAFDLGRPAGPRPLAAVVISADTAARQARNVGVPVALELDLLLVHGVLHLAGYDDHDVVEARRMHGRAREILSRRGRTRIPERFWRGLLPSS
jgi:probable rRNA maturation factor